MRLTQDEIDAARAKVAEGKGAELAGRSCLTDGDIDFAIRAAEAEPARETTAPPPKDEKSEGEQKLNSDPEKAAWPDAKKELMKKNGPQLRKVAEGLDIDVPEGAEREAIADLILAKSENQD